MIEHAADRLLTRREVEDHFGISKRFLEISTARGDGPPIIRIGRLVRYRFADVQAWIDSQRSGDETSEASQ